MQIRDDQEPLLEATPSRRQETTSIHRLVRRNPAEDETVRLPLSVVALWRDSVEPDLEGLRVRLKLPADHDDEDTLSPVPRTRPD